MVRLTQRWVALLLACELTGCATASSGQPPSGWSQKGFSAPPSPAAPSRFQLSMSDSPAAGGAPPGAPSQGYNVPGRNPDSEEPWKLFLGNAAHRLIAFMYGTNHPGNKTYYNTEPLKRILTKAGLGNTSRLLPEEQEFRPDITDVTEFSLFEIKPWNDRGLNEGRQEATLYLAALNRAAAPSASFSGGTDFQGEILIRFARGQFIWRLEWRTTEPGVTQYRWTRSQQRHESEAAAYAAPPAAPPARLPAAGMSLPR
jgi:hypothetical protein